MLAIESAAVLRADLRLVVMSATIDGARFAALLGAAPVIESAGKAYPLAIRWLGARPELRIDDAVANAVLTAWREEQADILVFLPGVGEIERNRVISSLTNPSPRLMTNVQRMMTTNRPGAGQPPQIKLGPTPSPGAANPAPAPAK